MEEKPISPKKTFLSQYIFRVEGFDAHDPDADGKGEYHLILKIRDNRMPDLIIEDSLREVIGKAVSVIEVYALKTRKPRIEQFLGAIKGWYRSSSVISTEEGFHRPRVYHYFQVPEGSTEALSLCRKWRIHNPSVNDLEEDWNLNLIKRCGCQTCFRALEYIISKKHIKELGLKYDSKGMGYIPDPKAHKKEHRS